MEKEGLIAKDDWGKGQFAAERAELADVLEEGNAEENLVHQQNLNNLDPSVREFIDEAAKAEGLEEEKTVAAPAAKAVAVKPEADEATVRQQMRARIAGKVPVDPKGEAEVYLVIRSTDQKSIEMGREFERFYNKNKADKKSLIKGLTLNTEDAAAINAYRARSKATFPIRDGSVFIKQLNVTKTPAIIVIAKNTGQAVVEEGQRNFYYIDELLNAVKGGSR